jgi:NAD(P)-dependent dehydrogenase (short-subunit alcohol dehydrogenase family)
MVTGAARGIGRAEALALAQQGAAVVVIDLESGPEGEAVAAEIRSGGGRSFAVAGDVTSWQSMSDILDRTIGDYGRVDILACNAGFLRDKPFAQMTEDEWDSVIDVHLRGAFIPTRLVVAHWLQDLAHGRLAAHGAKVILTSSESGLLGQPAHVNYSAAKAAVATMAVCLGRDLADSGIAVSAICPRARTRLNQHKVPTIDAWAPENVGAFVAYLASLDDESFAGQVFGVGVGSIDLYEGWHRTARVEAPGGVWTVDSIARSVPEMFADRPPALPDLDFMSSLLEGNWTW